MDAVIAQDLETMKELSVAELESQMSQIEPEEAAEMIARFADFLIPVEIASHSAVNVLYEDRSGHLWVGTGSGGLHRFDGETFDEGQGLPDNTIWAILEDDLGFFWMSSNRGMARAHFLEPRCSPPLWTHYSTPKLCRVTGRAPTIVQVEGALTARE